MRQFLALAFVLFLATPALAAPAPQPDKGVQVRIAVVDMDFIRRNAKVVKDVSRQLQTYRQSFQAEIQKEDEELRNANQELARQRAILAPEGFADERRKFEQRVAEAQKLVETRRRTLEELDGQAMNKIQQVVTDIITEIANEAQLTLILRKEQTVLLAPSLEITGEVLKRLDAKLPAMKVAAKPGK